MLILKNISYQHSNKELLFDKLHLSINRQSKVALIGNNGAGKSTLLKIIAGELQPGQGQVNFDGLVYYVPQLLGQFDHLSIAQALGIDAKLRALHEILNGRATEDNLNLLNDDWSLEERCRKVLEDWELNALDLEQKMSTLSGGQKPKVLLAGVSIHQPALILLDEPSNHLDLQGRRLLYDLISSLSATLLVVSHDRKLLNLLDTVCELDKNGINVYGGNYDFYVTQKQIEKNALSQYIHSKEKALRKAQEKERETVERQQKLDARGKKKQEKAGIARIMMNTLRNKAENSTSRLKSAHAEKRNELYQELQALRSALPDLDKMKLELSASDLHVGKILVKATAINFQYGQQLLWKEALNFQILSGERLALKGGNGSGKTTLLQLILGKLKPQTGELFLADFSSLYIDQDHSLLHPQLSVYEQAYNFNTSGLQEHEIKTRLSRFLFRREDWSKPYSVLSGGERMRLVLCCLMIGNRSPDLLVLDEPTNNLDLQNIAILTNAIKDYKGTLIVVSHDESFLEQINVERILRL